MHKKGFKLLNIKQNKYFLKYINHYDKTNNLIVINRILCHFKS